MCSVTAKIFPNTKYSWYKHYREEVRINLADNISVLDIGGGKRCTFADECRTHTGVKIIALDVSAEELAFNNDADEKIVFDLTSGKRVPLEDEAVDMVTSSSVLEHLNDLESAVKEVSRIIKPGGKFISVFPCKFALFAIINQLIPGWLARKIIFAVFPGRGKLGIFKAYYDRCYYPALKSLWRKNRNKKTSRETSNGRQNFFTRYLLRISPRITSLPNSAKSISFPSSVGSVITIIV